MAIEIVTLAPTPIIDAENAPIYYLQITEDDVARLAHAAPELVGDLVADFISHSGQMVWGGDKLVTGGLNFDVYKPLRIWRGKLFEEFNAGPASFAVPTPDATNPRIDRLYATLTEEADGLEELRHVKLNPADDGSLEADANVVVSKRNKVTLVYLAGTPAASPSAPDLPEGAVSLYQIFVEANAVSLGNSNFTDERYRFLTLEEVNQQLALLWEIVNKLKSQQPPWRADQVLPDTAQLDPSVQTSWLDVQLALNDLSRKIKGGGTGGGGGDDDTAGQRPLIDRLDPALLPSDPAHGTLGATGTTDQNAAPCVQIPMPRDAVFAGVRRHIVPTAFVDPALNARLQNLTVGGDDHRTTLTTPLNLSNVVVEETDGSGTFELQNPTVPVNVNRGIAGNRRIAPRGNDADGHPTIDLFGVGAAAGVPNTSWYEFDTVEETFTARTMTGDLPQYGILAAFSLGNGSVLLAGPGGGNKLNDAGRVKWYLLNATTGVSTYIPGGPGDVHTTETLEFNVMGDLVIGGPSGVVSLIVWAEGIVGQFFTAQFEYHIDSNTFTQIAVIGTGPQWTGRGAPVFQHMDCCVYQPGELVLVDGFSGPAHTWVFNHANKSWRPLNITQPHPESNPFINGYLWGLSVCNSNGRILLASGSSTIWQLTPGSTGATWSQIRVPAMEQQTDTSRWGSCMTGLLKDGLPVGTGYLLGGSVGINSNAPPTINAYGLRQVWKFVGGGVVVGNCSASPGITLDGGSTSATVRVKDSAPLPWAVTRYTLTVLGITSSGQVSALVSFDSGVHKLAVGLGRPTPIPYSDPTPVRELWLTITGTANQKPCLISVTETFEDAAGTTTNELVLWFNPPVGTNYLKMDKAGFIRLEANVEPSDPDLCYLLKVIRTGGGAPTVYDIKNKPFIHDYVQIDKAHQDAGNFFNYFPVPPAVIKARKIDASGVYKSMNNPAAPFDGFIVPAGLGVGEVCELELEG